MNWPTGELILRSESGKVTRIEVSSVICKRIFQEMSDFMVVEGMFRIEVEGIARFPEPTTIDGEFVRESSSLALIDGEFVRESSN